MGRDYQINGPTVVKVRCGSKIPLSELGISSGPVTIKPRFRHQDILADDYGPEIPAEVMWILADAEIEMTLVHYDNDVLDDVLAQSMCGTAGTFEPAGQLMGRGNGNKRFIELGIIGASGSDFLERPWHFPSAYLADRPLELPLGTARSLAKLVWRAVAYEDPTGEVMSIGATLWDHESM